ncbi:hypothetical protein ABT297_42915 [Dactylosporangium sp. NPDC000555]|uniref:hypothetical protein n=1 Tax=Dactylosporangium sp. NPDC000555 TaxID=3154260 RepID=UPI00331EE9F7
MSEDAPVNAGAVDWPSVDSAYVTVRKMQIKLHRWAGEDHSRRFDDLFNLVYDPAFLMHAWERVESNSGAKTAGVDRLTVAGIKTWIGVEAFLGRIRDVLKSGAYEPADVRRVKIPKAGGQFRSLGISDRGRSGGPGQSQSGTRTHLRGGLSAVLVWVPP